MVTWKDRGLGTEPQENFLKTTPFPMAINVTNALLHVRVVLEKHEKVAVFKSKENMFVVCWL